jgi:hypothetical protein
VIVFIFGGVLWWNLQFVERRLKQCHVQVVVSNRRAKGEMTLLALGDKEYVENFGGKISRREATGDRRVVAGCEVAQLFRILSSGRLWYHRCQSFVYCC